MVECQPSKLAMRVRFPSPAPPPMPGTDERIFPKAYAGSSDGTRCSEGWRKAEAGRERSRGSTPGKGLKTAVG